MDLHAGAAREDWEPRRCLGAPGASGWVPVPAAKSARGEGAELLAKVGAVFLSRVPFLDMAGGRR